MIQIDHCDLFKFNTLKYCSYFDFYTRLVAISNVAILIFIFNILFKHAFSSFVKQVKPSIYYNVFIQNLNC